MININFVILLL